MKKFTEWLAEFLFKRSPHQAMIPQVPQSSPEDPFADLEQGDIQPIEKYFEVNYCVGQPFKLVGEDIAVQNSNGHLIRGRAKPSVELGCGHLVDRIQPTQTDNNHIKGIAGACYYCQGEIRELLKRQERTGKLIITPFDSTRLTLVCSECTRISVSGKLCCPRHSLILHNENGETTCLGVEEIESMQKKERIRKILSPILALFTEEVEPPPQKVILQVVDEKQLLKKKQADKEQPPDEREKQNEGSEKQANKKDPSNE